MVTHFFNGVNYLKLETGELLEILYDLDRIRGEIKKIENKICKICNEKSESKPVTYTIKDEKKTNK